MYYLDPDIYENDELKHWGIIGMHWGIRRFQNPDGSLTPEGRERYGVKTAAEVNRKSYNQLYEVLKYKDKKRTKEEEEAFQRLENGRNYLYNVLLPGVIANKPLKALGPEEHKLYMQAFEYVWGTNAAIMNRKTQWLVNPYWSYDMNQIINDSDFISNMSSNNIKAKEKKDEEIKYINDNWNKASKEVEAQLKNDKRYQKYVNDKSYHKYDDSGERIDYYTILWDKTQRKLENEYRNKSI